jgi:cysteine desulfurase / selenocysteine lyase
MMPSDPSQVPAGQLPGQLPGGQFPGVDDFGSLSAAMAGMPDPVVMARLANEFFRDVSAQSMGMGGLPTGMAPTPQMLGDMSSPFLTPLVAPMTPTANGMGSMPTGVPTAIPGGIPTLSAMTSPAALRETSAIPMAVPSTGSTLPGVAELNTFGDPSRDLGTFSFLQESRTLFAAVPAVPVHAAYITGPTTIKIPGETELLRLMTGFDGTTVPTVPDAPAGLANPQLPGSPNPMPTANRDISFGFLNDLKLLLAMDVSPYLVPLGSDLGAVAPIGSSAGMFDVQSVRRDFPILQEQVNGRPLIWLDNAATTQKPQTVIDRLKYFYEHENSNIHRAAHTLAARATDAYEAAREKTRRFLNAASVDEIIFVRGATEGINLIAQSWGRRNIGKDDEIVITWLEHHANIVPWQMLCAEKGARLRVAPVDNTGQILLDEYEKLLGPKTKLVSLTHVSNALGTITPVDQMVAMARRHGAKVIVDGAQAVSHLRVDVQSNDCDFYVFSGHKVFAPTGIGVVYGKKAVLDDMPPWQGGGNMIADVTFEKTVYHDPPLRFEAGTGNIADAVGLGAAIDYLDRLGMVNIARHEHDLLVYGMDALKRIPGLRLIGTAAEKASVMSFVLDGFRTEDVGAALNREGIAVRSGHHCAQPILRRFGLESTVRPSLALYNTCDDVDALVAAIWNLKNGRTSMMV